MLDDRLATLARELPALVARTEIDRYLKGVINARHLANLDSEGKGPAHFHIGRKAVYRREDLLEWLKGRITEDKAQKDACIG